MNELLIEGLSAMLIGMGTVLSFLCLMIISMFIMSKIVRKLNEIFPEAVPEVAGANKKVSNGDDSEVAAAIIAAMYRKAWISSRESWLEFITSIHELPFTIHAVQKFKNIYVKWRNKKWQNKLK